MRIISLDTETTGLVGGFHDIIQLGAVVVDESLKELGTIEFEIKPLHLDRVQRRAMEVNGLDIDKIMDTGLDYDEALGKFGEFCQPHRKMIPLAQNWPFDKSFLEPLLGDRFGKLLHWEYLDAKVVAGHYNIQARLLNILEPFPKKSLAGLCNTLDVDNSNAHTALADAQALIEIYRKLVAFKVDKSSGMVYESHE